MTAPGPVQAFLDAQPREQLDFLTVAEKRQYMRHLSDLNYLRYGRRPGAGADGHRPPGADAGRSGRVREYRPAAPPARCRRTCSCTAAAGGSARWTSWSTTRSAGCAALGPGAWCWRWTTRSRRSAGSRPRSSRSTRWSPRIVAAAGRGEVDPGAVSVGGVSAGGNLAAALTLECRREGGPRLASSCSRCRSWTWPGGCRRCRRPGPAPRRAAGRRGRALPAGRGGGRARAGLAAARGRPVGAAAGVRDDRRAGPAARRRRAVRAPARRTPASRQRSRSSPAPSTGSRS